jgi:hypothetical protein
MENYNIHDRGVIFFSHCPKTAGTTVRQILTNNFPAHTVIDFDLCPHIHQVGLSIANQRPSLVVGHFYYGIHELINLNAPNVSYLTFIRNPVELQISLYYYSRLNEKAQSHQLAMSLPNVIEWAKHSDAPHNSQVRFLCGYNRGLNVDLALDRLFNQYAFFGLVDYMAESICLMGHVFGLEKVNYYELNKTPRDRIKKEIYDQLREISLEKDRMDVQLYNEAKKRFELILGNLTQHENDQLKIIIDRARETKNFSDQSSGSMQKEFV